MKRLMGSLLILGWMMEGALAAPPLKIVTTTADLADIARQVAGDLAEVRSICDGLQDPHFLTARPGYVLAARDADMWIRVGLELEIGWESPVLEGSRNMKILVGRPGHLDASETVIKLDIPQGMLSRALGDVHPSGNPHYWLDPYNARLVAAAMAERLSEIHPEGELEFQANLAGFQKELDVCMFGAALVEKAGGERLWQMQRDGTLEAFLAREKLSPGGWLGAMAPLKGQKLITYHKSWIYLAGRFGLTVAGELEPKPGVPPTAAHLASLEALMKQDQIGLILQEPFYSRKYADRLAVRTGARVVVVPNAVIPGRAEGETYLKMLDHVVKELAGKS